MPKLVHSLKFTVHRILKTVNRQLLTINRKSRGFTLIELLVVMTIISVITGIGYVNFDNARDKGRDARRKEDLKAIKTALTSYYQNHDHYPPASHIASPTTFSSDDGFDPWIPDLRSE